MILYCSKMRVAVVKATKQTFWSLMESSDSSLFNPFDVSLPYSWSRYLNSANFADVDHL